LAPPPGDPYAGALGVVYGDIGTSPLYAVRQSVLATGGQMPMEVAIMAPSPSFSGR